MKRAILLVSLLLVAMGSLAGCSFEAKAPKYVGWGSPPPPASIPQAEPSSKADLLRENQQLRQRTAWLEERIRKLAQESREIEADKKEIQAEMAKLAAERDRYRRAAR